MNNFNIRDVRKIETFLKEAGEHLLSFYDNELNILNKDKRDIKAEADQLMEMKIRDFLKSEFTFPILGEEFGDDGDFNDLTGFVIDPIDGTYNFTRKNPIFCISVAFLEKGNPLFGIVYNPILKEMISGIVGDGVYLNDIKQKSRNSIEINQSVVGTGFPTKMNLEDDERLKKYFENMKKFKKVRMLGSAAQTLAWIGIGRLDAYFENSIMLWDVAAGLAIVEASGGCYSIEQLEELDFSFNVSAAIDNKILQEII